MHLPSIYIYNNSNSYIYITTKQKLPLYFKGPSYICSSFINSVVDSVSTEIIYLKCSACFVCPLLVLYANLLWMSFLKPASNNVLSSAKVVILNYIYCHCCYCVIFASMLLYWSGKHIFYSLHFMCIMQVLVIKL